DLERETAFWTAALDYVTREEDSDDFALLRPRDGLGPNISLDLHHAADRVPPRIHLDLYAEDQAAEVRRLIGLGATEVHWDKRPIAALDARAPGHAAIVSMEAYTDGTQPGPIDFTGPGVPPTPAPRHPGPNVKVFVFKLADGSTRATGVACTKDATNHSSCV